MTTDAHDDGPVPLDLDALTSRITLPDPEARRTILSGLQDLLRAFAAGDGPLAADLILRFIYDAETAYRRVASDLAA